MEADDDPNRDPAGAAGESVSTDMAKIKPDAEADEMTALHRLPPRHAFPIGERVTDPGIAGEVFAQDGPWTVTAKQDHGGRTTIGTECWGMRAERAASDLDHYAGKALTRCSHRSASWAHSLAANALPAWIHSRWARRQ